MPQKKTHYIPAGSTEWQEKFICCLMRKGKKSLARRIFNEALGDIQKKGKKPEEIFEKAVKTIMPQTEVRARRVGGSVYQIPVEVKPKRQLALSIRWIIGAARSRKGKPMAQKLAEELLEASSETGVAFKKREDVHRMAQANKAFAHFARYTN